VVFLNGNYISKSDAFISVMDRGFLFGDGVYEVIPVYNRKLFKPSEHLERLQKSLNSTQISNPYSEQEWHEIIGTIVSSSDQQNQSVYLQISRGTGSKRSHTFDELVPSVYVESNPLVPRTQKEMSTGFKAITMEDIRWDKCDIKSISLLANVLYSQKAKQSGAEEAILYKNNTITEGATSNVFSVKNDVLFTHPIGSNILSGITRDLVLQSAKSCKITVKEKAFSLEDLFNSDEVWISSSTREVVPITTVDNVLINNGKVGSLWKSVHENYRKLINEA